MQEINILVPKELFFQNKIMTQYNSRIIITNSDTDRPLNPLGFTVCHTVSVSFSRSHSRFFISHGFTNRERIFSQTHSFLKKKTTKKTTTNKQTQTAHSNDTEERISRMINKKKTSTLYLSWKLLFIKLVKTHIETPF